MPSGGKRLNAGRKPKYGRSTVVYKRLIPKEWHMLMDAYLERIARKNVIRKNE